MNQKKTPVKCRKAFVFLFPLNFWYDFAYLFFLTWHVFVYIFFSCPCFYFCQHGGFISLTKNNKHNLLAQHETFSSPLRNSIAFSAFSHKMILLWDFILAGMCRFTICHVWNYQHPVFGRKDIIFGRKKLCSVSVPVMLEESEAV